MFATRRSMIRSAGLGLAALVSLPLAAAAAELAQP